MTKYAMSILFRSATAFSLYFPAGLSYGADVHVTANCSTFSPVATYMVTGYSPAEFVTALGTVSIEYNCTKSAHVVSDYSGTPLIRQKSVLISGVS